MAAWPEALGACPWGAWEWVGNTYFPRSRAAGWPRETEGPSSFPSEPLRLRIWKGTSSPAQPVKRGRAVSKRRPRTNQEASPREATCLQFSSIMSLYSARWSGARQLHSILVKYTATSLNTVASCNHKPFVQGCQGRRCGNHIRNIQGTCSALGVTAAPPGPGTERTPQCSPKEGEWLCHHEATGSVGDGSQPWPHASL